MTRRRSAALAVSTALVLACATAAVRASDARSLPLDCFPDAVASWEAVDPALRFGATNVPGIVLGPPGESLPTQGSTTVASLGVGGAMTWALSDIVIEDRPGPDFIVFENAFFQGAPPASPEDDYRVFAEPGIVEVSADGVTWKRFAFDPLALEAVRGLFTISRAQQAALRGLAGITPTFTGNWTIADDPLDFDASGTGGISGAGGDAFDLADVELTVARFVRVIDARGNNGFAGAAEGFDVDTLVVLHGRPVGTTAADSDRDGLADVEEATYWGSSTVLADSDGDGTDDGREVAGCRDPLTSATEAAWRRAPRIFLRGNGCTEVRTSFVGSNALFDVARGSLAFIGAAGGAIDLGPLTCLANDTASLRFSCDAEAPVPGEAFFYLVRVQGDAMWGRGSSLLPRQAQGGCP